jgi:SAM-dependent methyltransferase
MMHQLDVPVSKTLQFVVSALPPSAARTFRILEVGCGTGSLAARLAETGYQVLALDSSPKAVRIARAKGVDAHAVRWPSVARIERDSEYFDAVLFSRSLHHIRPLDQALDQASRLLTPGGVVVIEDFAFHELDRATATWFFGVLLLLDASGLFTESAREFGRHFLQGGGSLDLWCNAQDHEITPAPEIRAAVARRFELVSEVAEPYLYRYAAAMLRATRRGAVVAAQLYELEKKMADDGLVRLIGRRLVGRKPS